jgi:hypothetical protein
MALKCGSNYFHGVAKVALRRVAPAGLLAWALLLHELAVLLEAQMKEARKSAAHACEGDCPNVREHPEKSCRHKDAQYAVKPMIFDVLYETKLVGKNPVKEIVIHGGVYWRAWVLCSAAEITNANPQGREVDWDVLTDPEFPPVPYWP